MDGWVRFIDGLVGLGWMGFRLIRVQLEVFGKWYFFLGCRWIFFGGN